MSLLLYALYKLIISLKLKYLNIFDEIERNDTIYDIYNITIGIFTKHNHILIKKYLHIFSFVVFCKE